MTPTTPTDLVPRAPSSIIFGVPGRVTATALELPSDLTLEQWRQTGLLIGRVDKAARWWIGDWLNFGESRYGEQYSQFADACGYAPHTLTNLARAAREIGADERRPELEWSHHEAVVGLQPADRLRILDMAVKGEGGFPLPVTKVREMARAAKAGRPIDPVTITPAPNATPEPLVSTAWQTLASRLVTRLVRDVPDAQFWQETIDLETEMRRGMDAAAKG